MSPLHPLPRSTAQIVDQERTLFGGSPLPMVATQGRAHVIQYVNPAFCWLFGQAPEGIVGRPLNALLCKASQRPDEDAAALLDLVYSTGTAEFAVDLIGVSGDARTVTMRCAVWPILGNDGRPGGLLVQVSAPSTEVPTRHVDSADEQRQVNEQLLLAGLKAQEQAEAQIALRSTAEAAVSVRDEFISTAAHELRTPVTGIKMSAQLALRALEDPTPDTERTIRYLLGIVSGANRLVLLMNDLMDVSRMRSGELVLRVTPVDLAGLVRTIALRYAETVGERHQVKTHMPAASLVVAGDAVRLEQLLDNLLSNAVKYSPAGGEIGVTLRQADEGIVVTVNDPGIGLTPGAEVDIFQPFGRAANARRQGLPGLGLGLHICRQIAVAHGGRMWAQSDGEGQGMTVGIWLPAA